MFCQRCRRLLVRETFDDPGERTGSTAWATRCINCGYIEDSVVRANRLRPHTAKRSVPDGRFTTGGVVFMKTHSEEHRFI